MTQIRSEILAAHSAGMQATQASRNLILREGYSQFLICMQALL